MKTNLYDFVMAELQKTKGTWPDVATGSGVSKRTLEKIARKEIPNPGVHTVQKLKDYFTSAKVKQKRKSS